MDRLILIYSPAPGGGAGLDSMREVDHFYNCVRFSSFKHTNYAFFFFKELYLACSISSNFPSFVLSSTDLTLSYVLASSNILLFQIVYSSCSGILFLIIWWYMFKHPVKTLLCRKFGESMEY